MCVGIVLMMLCMIKGECIVNDLYFNMVLIPDAQ